MAKRNNRGGARQGQNNNPTFGNSTFGTPNSSTKMFNCSVHGANKTHDTKDCKANKQPNAKAKTCTNCGKVGHLKKDCRLLNQNASQQAPAGFWSTHNNSSPQGRRTSTLNQKASPMLWSPTAAWGVVSPKKSHHNQVSEVTAMPYCFFCNKIDHNSRGCRNDKAILDFHHSSFVCQKCLYKGHLRSECLNPRPRTNPFTDLRKIKSPTVGRNGPYLYGGSQAKEMRQRWEEYQLKMAAQGSVIDPDFFIQTEREIREMAAKEIGERGLGYVSASRSSPRRSSPRSPSAFLQSPSKSKSRLKKVSAINNQFTFEPPKEDELDELKGRGVDTKSIEILKQMRDDKRVKDKEAQIMKDLRRKANINSYHKSCVTTAFRNQENWILENRVLTQGRLWEIKMTLANGASIWRDPHAMTALIDRQLPQCEKCSESGRIYDRHFNEINPALVADEIFALEDGPAWGLFVGMGCRCSGQAGYTWETIPKKMMEKFEDKWEWEQQQRAQQGASGQLTVP
ncbi:hypothetical protein PRZ48_004852 [Zasmidium cellare]|uniref:CCHC-type domain-containing protein n=1 Tax=Zasmidium cellare TaxID=395010 RepID=A0ABR0EQY5_ZASCE|nr:hypothetical protein PRZ48_004852 [Zasmidium cellare]